MQDIAGNGTAGVQEDRNKRFAVIPGTDIFRKLVASAGRKQHRVVQDKLRGDSTSGQKTATAADEHCIRCVRHWPRCFGHRGKKIKRRDRPVVPTKMPLDNTALLG